MQRIILISLAVISLLLGVSAAIGSHPAPTQADTIPPYGCPATLDGSPIGGGLGYLDTIDPSQADYVVDTAAELKSALAAATSGEIVYVDDGATITIDSSTWYGNSSSGIGRGCYLEAGVTLAGGRGRDGVTGGIIKVDSALQPTTLSALIWCAGSSCRITGLTLVGAQDGTTGDNLWCGIWAGDSTNIENNEIHGFGFGAVRVDRDITDVWVHHNYIHHNRQAGYGYGVYVNAFSIYYTASALVEGNHFDYSRHHIAASHGRSSYTFRYNYLGANCTNTQIDVHGQNAATGDDLDKDGSEYIHPAGEDVEICYNTSLCTSNPFVGIRGIPYSTGSVSVHNNWTYTTEAQRWHLDDDDPHVCTINQQMSNIPPYYYDAPDDGAFVRMTSEDNWYGAAAPPSTNVAPVLNAIGDKSVNEGTTLSFTISGSDANGDALTYAASNLPAGAAFDPVTQTFSWTPVSGRSGVYAGIHFQVSDGTLTDSEDITITVTVNNPLQADVNGDGAVNSLDMIMVGQHWNETGESGWIREDINRDGTVNVLDATLVGQNWTG